jgi:hypothetical protein
MRARNVTARRIFGDRPLHCCEPDADIARPSPSASEAHVLSTRYDRKPPKRPSRLALWRTLVSGDQEEAGARSRNFT